jgi:hypothetical protein
VILISFVSQAMATINPAQIAYLNKLQPQFKFHERIIVFPSQEAVADDANKNKQGEGDDKSSGGDGFAMGSGEDDDEFLGDDDLLGDEKEGDETARPISGMDDLLGPDEGSLNNGGDEPSLDGDSAGGSITSAGQVQETASSPNKSGGMLTRMDSVATEGSGEHQNQDQQAPGGPTSPTSAFAGNVSLAQASRATTFNGTFNSIDSALVSSRDGVSREGGTFVAAAVPAGPTEADVRKKLAAQLNQEDMLLYDRLMWLMGRLPISNNTVSLLGEYARNHMHAAEEIPQPRTYQDHITGSANNTLNKSLTSTGSRESNSMSIVFTNDGVSQSVPLTERFFETFNTTSRRAPYDEFEGIAGKMLLGIVEFLKTGDVTAFSPEDRMDWIAYVLKSAAPAAPAAQTPAVGKETARPTTTASTVSATGDNSAPDHAAKLLSILAATDDLNHYSFNSTTNGNEPMELDAIQRATDEVAKSTWRTMSMSAQVRVPPKTLHAGAVGGVAAIKTKAAETQSKLFKRIIEMRTAVKEAMKRQIVKYYTRGLPGTGEETMNSLAGGSRGLIGAAYDIQPDEDEDYYAPLNIYAGNLRMAIEQQKKSELKETFGGFNDSVIEDGEEET